MQMSAHTQHGTPYRAPALSFPSSQHSEQRHIPLDAISTVPSSLPIYRGCRSRLQPRLHQAAALCTDWHWHIWGKLQGQTGANSILLPIPSLPLLPELCTQRGSQTKTSRKCPKKKPLRATQAVRQHQGEGGGLGGHGWGLQLALWAQPHSCGPTARLTVRPSARRPHARCQCELTITTL